MSCLTVILNIIGFFNTKIGIAVASALLIPILIFFVGSVLELLTLVLVEFLSLFVGVNGAYLVVNYLSFIGTIHHELSHAIVAFLTGAKIVNIKLYNSEGNTLGSVSYYTRGNIVFKSLQSTLGAVAPMFCGYITITSLIRFAQPLLIEVWQKILFWYLLIVVSF